MLTSERTRIAYIAFVKLDVLLCEIGCVDHRASSAQVQVHVQIKFLFRDGCAKTLEGCGSGLTPPQAPNDLTVPRCAVADIHFVLYHFGGTVSECINNAPPIRIAAMPACLNQRAI